jgi:hypothetical protein
MRGEEIKNRNRKTGKFKKRVDGGGRGGGEIYAMLEVWSGSTPFMGFGVPQIAGSG